MIVLRELFLVCCFFVFSCSLSFSLLPSDVLNLVKSIFFFIALHTPHSEKLQTLKREWNQVTEKYNALTEGSVEEIGKKYVSSDDILQQAEDSKQ